MRKKTRKKKNRNRIREIYLSVFLCLVLLPCVPAEVSAVSEAVPDTSGAPAAVWDGESVDVSWYNPSETEFHISTPAQLAGLSAISNGIAVGRDGENISADDFTGKTICLDADIRLNDHKSTGRDETAHEWTPITGVYYIDRGLCTPFNGTLDGQGHAILNIYCYRTGTYAESDGLSERGVALIGYSAEGAVVRNLSLTGCLYGNRYVAGFIGKTGTRTLTFDPSAGPGSTVENCSNYADITSTGFRGSGGIVGAGWNHARIRGCANYGTITGLGTDKQGTTGGIAGESEGEITGCANYGKVVNILTTEKANAGGIVGDSSGAVRTSACINYGTVTGGTAGGISGFECANLQNCLNLGGVTGAFNEGSVIGELKSAGEFSALYYRTGTSASGIGKVSAGGDRTEALEENRLEEEDLLDTLGRYNGKEPEDPDSGFFVRGWDGLPKLYQCGNQGSGASDLVPAITDPEELRRFSASLAAGADYTGQTVQLMADLDLAEGDGLPGSWYTVEDTYYEDQNSANPSWYSGTFPRPVFTEEAEYWEPAGTPEHPFTGVFEGGGHTVRGLCTKEEGSFHGFFGCLGQGAAVRDLHIGEGALAGHSFVGGIAGYAVSAAVENCTNAAMIFASGGAEPGKSGLERAGYAGGIIGRAAGTQNEPFSVNGCRNTGSIVCPNCFHGGRAAGIVGIVDTEEDTGVIRSCGNAGPVCTFQYGGGIVGLQWSEHVSIEACFNTAGITGCSPSKGYIGGIAGLCNGPVSNCYNTGSQISAVEGNGGMPTRYAGIAGQSASGITNCYDAGARIHSYWEGMGTSGPIVGDAQGSAPVNCFSLTAGSGADQLTPEELKAAAERLGSAFTDDTEQLNEGYPVLRWQVEAEYAPDYPVTVLPAAGAAVQLSKQRAKQGEKVTVTVSAVSADRAVREVQASDGNGRRLEVREEGLSQQEAGSRQYSFIMPDQAVTVSVVLGSAAPLGAVRDVIIERPDNIWSVSCEAESFLAVPEEMPDSENENDGFRLAGKAGSVRANDLVTVKVERMAGAYQSGLAGLSVSGVAEEDLTVLSEVKDTYNGYVREASYAFPMPDRDVAVSLKTACQEFSVGIQTGSGAPESRLSLSRQDMEDLAETETIYYAGYDSAPYAVVGIAKKAVKLSSVLEKAGLTFEEGDSLKLQSTDGYERLITYEELMGEPRYYFPEISGQAGGREQGIRQLDPMLVIAGYQSRESGDDSGRSSLTENQTIDDKIADTLNTYRFVYGQTTEQYEQKQNTIGHMPKHVYSITVVKKDSGTSEDHDRNCPASKFADLDRSRWYHEAVDYVLEKKLFYGVSETGFAPDGTMTRAMFVTVLGRAAGVEALENAHSSFRDVADGKWYTPYVDWAAEKGIVNGYDSVWFGTDDSVTREQMAAILYRYAKHGGVDVSGADSSRFHSFRDAGQVADYAKEPMVWAVSQGILNGMGDGTLAPKETATRAAVAQILLNYDREFC